VRRNQAPHETILAARPQSPIRPAGQNSLMLAERKKARSLTGKRGRNLVRAFGSPKHDAAISRGAAIFDKIPDSGIEGGIELAIAVSAPRTDARFMDLKFSSPADFWELRLTDAVVSIRVALCEAEPREEILEKIP
jgi:hypothetical protein